MEGENEEVMDVFEDSDFPNEEIEDTTDDASKENEEESDESDDETKDDAADLDDEVSEADPAKDDDITNAPTPKTFKVIINHQEREVSEADPDFISYLQKGMDYDRVKDQVNTYKNDPRLAFVENQAKQLNMTPEQFINAIHAQQYQSEIDELIDSGVNEAVAKEVVDTRRQKQQETQTQQQPQAQKELVDFVDYYAKINGKQFNPDTDTLPDEVWQANAGGTPLKVAYMEYLVQQKQEQQKLSQKQEEQKKQNEEAKKKAPVKGVSINGTGKSPKKDPQLDGLFED